MATPRFELFASSRMEQSLINSRLRKLEDVLLRNLPRSVQMLTVCRIALQQKFPEHGQFEFHIYLEEEEEDNSFPDVMNDDPLIVHIQCPNVHTKKGVLILSPAKITEEMISAFDTLISWDTPQTFHSVHESFWPAIQKLCKKHKNSEIEENSKGFKGKLCSILDVEKAKNLDFGLEKFLTENKLKIRPLKESDVNEVVGHWKWAQEHSEEEIKYQIKLLPSCGLFTEDGELASSVLQTTVGTFNVLYTPEKFRRRGFGHIVWAYVSREAARNLGTNPLGECEVWNEVSFKLMEKAGYEFVCNTAWIYYNPPSTSIS